MGELIDRIPPQALEAEMAVLGSMLIEKEAIIKVVDLISEKDFYKDAHRYIYNAIRDLYLNNQPVDAITISEELKKNKLFSDIGGTYITSLVNYVSTAANVEHYASLVREKSILRQLINAGSDIVYASFNEKKSADEIMDHAESVLYQIVQRGVTRGFIPLSSLVHPVLDHIEKLHINKNDVPGLRTHFKDFDGMTAGLQPAELIIVAGRPSMGKTAFALNIAENVALREKKPVAVFSLEMSKDALMLRLLCSAAKADAHAIRKGILPTNSWAMLTTVGDKLYNAPIYIDDSPNLSILELRARARRLANELKVQNKELSLIVIDYIQMMRGSGRCESRQQEIAEISRSLKGLARDLNIPVIALSQLSRKPEDKGREGNKPQLSDLRESGAIEQDADVVAFIYREGYYKRDDKDLQNQATLILSKQRNGPTGEIRLTFLPQCTRFEDAAPMNM